MLIIRTEIIDAIVNHAVENYPNEACGLLIGEKGTNSVTRFLPMKNIYDTMHARDPETYPRTAKTAYLIDPREQQQVFDDAAKTGQEVKAIVHSHTDHDAYFSEEDRLAAAPWGEPMFPGVAYVVISISDGKVKEINEFWWDDEKRDYKEIKII